MKAIPITAGFNAENLPVVVGVEIPLDESGRYNLNAIHKASGEGKHKSPGEWLRLKQTRELISELEAKLLKNSQDGNLRLAYKVVDSCNASQQPDDKEGAIWNWNQRDTEGDA
ncbi:KilA-N domain-containing protein [Salmonella enterica subsp. enterica serovar Newport]